MRRLPSLATQKLLRDTLMFLLGFGGAVNQIFFASQHDPALLAFLGGLMGLPAFLRRDEKKHSKEDDE